MAAVAYEKRQTCRASAGGGKDVTMRQAKQTSKRKRRSKALPVLGAAGLSLSLAGTASAVPGGPAVNLPSSGNGDGNQVFLDEEEIADVSLATFYVFDKEDLASGSNVELVRHGCHGCHGCGGRGWVSPPLRLPWVSRPRLSWLWLRRLAVGRLRWLRLLVRARRRCGRLWEIGNPSS